MSVLTVRKCTVCGKDMNLYVGLGCGRPRTHCDTPECRRKYHAANCRASYHARKAANAPLNRGLFPAGGANPPSEPATVAPAAKPCSICGADLPPHPGRGRVRTMHDGPCRKEYQRRTNLTRYRERVESRLPPSDPPPPVDAPAGTPCVTCGRELPDWLANPGESAAPRERGTKETRKANAAKACKASERRPLCNPATCEMNYTDEDTAFLAAMESYRRVHKRPFPTWTEALEVLRALGYRRVAEPEPIQPRIRPPRT